MARHGDDMVGGRRADAPDVERVPILAEGGPGRAGGGWARGVAMALVVVAAGGAVWWSAMEEGGPEDPAPDPRQAHGPTGGPWRFESIAPEEVCVADGVEAVRERLRPSKRGSLPIRLSDHLPTSSPLPAFGYSHEGPTTQFMRPWTKSLEARGLVQAYFRTFNSTSEPGGFTGYVYEFPTRRAARAAAADAFLSAVCDYGGEALAIADRPGIVAAARPSDAIIAWWVHGPRLVHVDYSLFAEEPDPRASALTVLQAVWEAA